MGGIYYESKSFHVLIIIVALYGLAWTGFIAVFAIQVFALYRKNAPQRQTFVQRVNSGINSINPQMSYYSP